MCKERIFYIDALRALAIILLVMYHIPQYYPFQPSFYVPIISVFDMALFFAISGFVVKTKMGLLKRMKLLIPFFIIGIVRSLSWGKSLGSFFTTLDKNGYWFLLVMLIFDVILYFIQKLEFSFHISFLVVEFLFGGGICVFSQICFLSFLY